MVILQKEPNKQGVGPSTETYQCIAVDMGASSVRIMLGTLESGRLSHQEVRRIENRTVFADGHDRWDMDKMINEITKGIREAWQLSRGGAESVGIDGWGVDFALLDSHGNLVSSPVSYRDSRTEGMQEVWEKEMSGWETFRRTGINFYPFNTLFQLLSMRNSSELERASSLLFLPGYVHFRLTGKGANDRTIASTSQMLGVDGDRWDPVILEKLSLPEGLLGEVIAPGTRLGKVRLPGKEVMDLEGVVVSGHDTACVVAAIPAVGTDYVYISAGTWCILGLESDTPVISKEAFEIGFTNERGWDGSYRLLKNIVGLWLVQGLRQQMPGKVSYGEIEELAKAHGELPQLIDPEDPEFYHPSDMKRAFQSYFQRTGQDLPAGESGYLRCAYQSLCCSFRHHLELLEKISGRDARVIHMVGGGSQSGFLNQLIADICNRPVLAGPVEAAVEGNILIQAMAMGRLDNMESGRRMIRSSRDLTEYLPGPETAFVRQLYDRFLQLIK
jgi:sugar (pentulose or hexulose) kinase